MAVIVEVLSRRDVELFLTGGGDGTFRAAVADFVRRDVRRRRHGGLRA